MAGSHVWVKVCCITLLEFEAAATTCGPFILEFGIQNQLVRPVAGPLLPVAGRFCCARECLLWRPRLPPTR
jgi:hypothetical protein